MIRSLKILRPLLPALTLALLLAGCSAERAAPNCVAAEIVGISATPGIEACQFDPAYMIGVAPAPVATADVTAKAITLVDELARQWAAGESGWIENLGDFSVAVELLRQRSLLGNEAFEAMQAELFRGREFRLLAVATDDTHALYRISTFDTDTGERVITADLVLARQQDGNWRYTYNRPEPDWAAGVMEGWDARDLGLGEPEPATTDGDG